MNRFRGSASSPDDPRLVEITMSLPQQLGIANLNIKEVRWTNIVPRTRGSMSMPSDWCFFFMHALVMPARMMGKLTVEEWRPLIASSILFEKKLRRPAGRKWWYYVMLPMFLVLVGGAGLAALYLYLVSVLVLSVSFLVLLLAPAAAIWGNRLLRPMLKKARLDADTDASVLTGKEAFLEVLRKIETFLQGDVGTSKADAKTRKTLGIPAITERINNLEGIPSSQGSQTI